MGFGNGQKAKELRERVCRKDLTKYVVMEVLRSKNAERMQAETWKKEEKSFEEKRFRENKVCDKQH